MRVSDGECRARGARTRLCMHVASLIFVGAAFEVIHGVPEIQKRQRWNFVSDAVQRLLGGAIPHLPPIMSQLT